MPDPRSDSIYHYTTTAALHSILGVGVERPEGEEIQLWATDMRFLNDTSEGIGRLHVEEACKALADQLERGTTDDRQRAKALVGLESHLGGMRRAFDWPDSHKPQYVACFSRAQDQLSQWRGYSQGGYCLEFSEPDVRATAGAANGAMKDVNYVGSYEGMEMDLLALADKWIEVEKSAMSIDDGDEHYSTVLAGQIDVGSEAEALGVFRKSDGFQEEREVRILLGGEPEFWSSDARYGLVPRRTVTLPWSALRKVWVGPSPYQSARVEALQAYSVFSQKVEEYIDEQGHLMHSFVRFPVQSSRIPYRS